MMVISYLSVYLKKAGVTLESFFKIKNTKNRVSQKVQLYFTPGKQGLELYHEKAIIQGLRPAMLTRLCNE